MQVFAARLGPELKHNAYGAQYVFSSPGSFHHMGCAVCFALEMPLPELPGAQSTWRGDGIQPRAHHTWREEPAASSFDPVSIFHPAQSCVCPLPQPWPPVPAFVKANVESQLNEQRKKLVLMLMRLARLGLKTHPFWRGQDRRGKPVRCFFFLPRIYCFICHKAPMSIFIRK